MLCGSQTHSQRTFSSGACEPAESPWPWSAGITRWSGHAVPLRSVWILSCSTASLVETATFFRPCLPTNEGIFFSLPRNWGDSSHHLPPPLSQMQKVSVAHQPWSLQLNLCVPCRLTSGPSLEIQLHRVWYVLFRLLVLSIYPTCCVPRYSFCCKLCF